MRGARRTGGKRKAAATKSKKKSPSPICPRCLLEPDEEVDPYWEGDLVEVSEDLRERGQDPYTHECRICGLQVYLERAERRRVATNKVELFAVMEIPDESHFANAIADWTGDHVTYEPINDFDDGVCIYGGVKGICLEYPIDVRQLRNCCQILAYVDRQDWKSEGFSPSKRELLRTIARLTKEITAMKETADPKAASNLGPGHLGQ